jgi:hypothetical protein
MRTACRSTKDRNLGFALYRLDPGLLRLISVHLPVCDEAVEERIDVTYFNTLHYCSPFFVNIPFKHNLYHGPQILVAKIFKQHERSSCRIC